MEKSRLAKLALFGTSRKENFPAAGRISVVKE